MKNEPITHDITHPITASGGPDNAYYLRHCEAVERGPSYAACLSRLHDIDADRSNERTAQCAQTVKQGRCPAHGMREQERLAGAALFYFPRTSKPFLPVSVAGDFGVLITNLTDPALIPKPARPFGEKVASPKSTKLAHELQTDALAVAINNVTASAGPSPGDYPEDRAIKAMPAPMPQPLTMKELHEELKKNPIEVELLPKALPASTSTKIQPGETPLQYARRMAELRKAK